MFALITLLSTLSVECPATINTEQQIPTAPSGWQAMVRDPAGQPTRQTTHYLDGLTLFDGEPGELASLKPDNGDADDTPQAPHRWSGLQSARLYLVCHYRGTAATLQQPLPAHLTSCTVSHKDKEQILGLRCQPGPHKP